jgi:hypothetical protein
MKGFESLLLAIDRDLVAGSCLEVVLNQVRLLLGRDIVCRPLLVACVRL